MLKLDASLAVSEIEDDGFARGAVALRRRAHRASRSISTIPTRTICRSWAVGAFYVERGKHAFMRFYDFLETVPAHVLVPLLPAAGAQSDLILSVIPYSLETNLA